MHAAVLTAKASFFCLCMASVLVQARQQLHAKGNNRERKCC